jgi:hypothetical protein
MESIMCEEGLIVIHTCRRMRWEILGGKLWVTWIVV